MLQLSTPRRPPSPAAAPAALLGLLASVPVGCAPVPEGAGVGQRPPTIELTDENGAPAPLPDDGLTAVVVWASWCRPCQTTALALAAGPPPPGLALAHVAIGGAPPVDLSVAAAWGLPGAPRFAPTPALLQGWAVEALPTILLLDGRGVVRMRGDDWPATRRVAAELLAHDD